MRANSQGLVWVAGVFAVTLVAAVACGSSSEPSPTASQTAEPAAAVSTAVLEDVGEAATQEYAAAVRTISELSDARTKEIFDPVSKAPPGPGSFLPMLAAALPLAIEGAQADIAALGLFAVPGGPDSALTP